MRTPRTLSPITRPAVTSGSSASLGTGCSSSEARTSRMASRRNPGGQGSPVLGTSFLRVDLHEQISISPAVAQEAFICPFGATPPEKMATWQMRSANRNSTLQVSCARGVRLSQRWSGHTGSSWSCRCRWCSWGYGSRVRHFWGHARWRSTSACPYWCSCGRELRFHASLVRRERGDMWQ